MRLDQLDNLDKLQDCVPYQLRLQDSRLIVDWCSIESYRFTDPFFEDTIRRRRFEQSNPPATYQTHTDTLVDLQVARPGLIPSAFIFHISRCGSTLISQLLAALPQHIVISEAPPIDSIIRANHQLPDLPDAQRIAWLQAIVSALGRRRFEYEQCYFIKLDSWHILDFAIIHRAFPNVPKLFLYRDPIDVICSLKRMPSLTILPGTIQPEQLGLQSGAVAIMPGDEYIATVLAAFFRTAISNQSYLRFLNYKQLPQFVWSDLLDWLNISVSSLDIERMKNAARFNTKTPGLPFTVESASRHRQLSDQLRALVADHLGPLYEAAEHIRVQV